MIKYTVYKTVNKVNGKFYIGVHKTSDPMDEYLGSGTVILRAIQKYGVSSFVKEILFEYETQEEAWAKEYELVKLHQGNPLCYNLRRGGEGGFDYINKSGIGDAARTKSALITNEILRKKFHSDPSYREKVLSGISGFWEGRTHEIRTRLKMAESAKNRTSVNNMKGRLWFYSGSEEKAIPFEESDHFLSMGWKRGRKSSKH